MVSSSNLAEQKALSPMDNLLIGLADQNNALRNLVERIKTVGHRLSDTNRPQAEQLNKEPSAPLPFENGHLMTFYHSLNDDMYLINQLREQVEKLEQLV